MINDRRDDMTVAAVVEELELSHPEKVASFERRYPDAMAAGADDDLGACDPDELDDLASDRRRLIRIERPMAAITFVSWTSSPGRRNPTIKACAADRSTDPPAGVLAGARSGWSSSIPRI